MIDSTATHTITFSSFDQSCYWYFGMLFAIDNEGVAERLEPTDYFEFEVSEVTKTGDDEYRLVFRSSLPLGFMRKHGMTLVAQGSLDAAAVASMRTLDSR